MTGPAVAHLLAVNITVGDHVQKYGLNFDTIWGSVVAALIVMGLGLALRAKVTSGVPGKLQLLWETLVQAVTQQVEGSIGSRGAAVIPLALALFVFILVANWFSVLGIGSSVEWLAPPTSDVNLTFALALIVIIPVHIVSIRTRGILGYVRHYVAQPFPWFLFPLNLLINVVEEIAKPITLALRLFGNLFSGGLMLTLIAALGAWKLGSFPFGDIWVLVFDVIWKLFDVFLIGPIQAFIFALLTILYFDTAMATDH